MRRRKKTNVVEASGNDTPTVHETKPEDHDKPSFAWGQVVKHVMHVPDPDAMVKRLQNDLQLEDPTNYGQLLASLNTCETNLYDAGRLSRAAKLEEELYQQRTEERLAGLHQRATDTLNAEYRAKTRPSPKIDDIRNWMIRHHGDVIHGIEREKQGLHHTVRALETLRDAWASRAASIRTMIERARQR